MLTELFSAMEIAQCTREEKKAPLALILIALELAKKAKTEGLLALEEDIESLPNPFFRDLLRMVIDGVDFEIIGKLALIRMSAERMRGVDMLSGLIALEAALAMQEGSNQWILASLLSSYLGKDRDLFSAIAEDLPWGEKAEPIDSAYFGVCVTPDDVIAKIRRNLIISSDERNMLNRFTGAEAMLDGIAPDILACTLSYLDASQKSEWFAMLSREKKQRVLEEMCALSSVDPEYMAIHAQAVLQKIQRGLETHSWPTGGIPVALEMFRSMKLEEAGKFIEYMEDHQPDLAFEFRAGWFKFEDISDLPDDLAIQKALRELDSQTLAKALRGASQTLQRRILDNMSVRAGKLLMEEIQCLETVPASEIVASRKQIAAIFSSLEMSGEITLER